VKRAPKLPTVLTLAALRERHPRERQDFDRCFAVLGELPELRDGADPGMQAALARRLLARLERGPVELSVGSLLESPRPKRPRVAGITPRVPNREPFDAPPMRRVQKTPGPHGHSAALRRKGARQ
jgi:hypothetical protein